MNHIYGILAGAMALAAVITPGTAGTATAAAQDVNCAAFIDKDGDGVCDNWNSDTGYGACFVDEDGDGICDYRNSNAGRGYGRGNRCGRGRR